MNTPEITNWYRVSPTKSGYLAKWVDSESVLGPTVEPNAVSIIHRGCGYLLYDGEVYALGGPGMRAGGWDNSIDIIGRFGYTVGLSIYRETGDLADQIRSRFAGPFDGN